MADSVDVILDFLRSNKFTRAEAALRGELSSRLNLNGSLQNLILEEKDAGNALEEEKKDKPDAKHQGTGARNSGELSKELIVKEIECGTARNGSGTNWRTTASLEERNGPSESAGTSDRGFSFAQASGETPTNMYSWKINLDNGQANPFEKDGIITSNFSELQISEHLKYRSQVSDKGNLIIGTVKYGESYGTELGLSGEQRTSWLGSTSKANADLKYERNQMNDGKALDKQPRPICMFFKDNLEEKLMSKKEEPLQCSVDPLKECSIKNVFPFSKGDALTSYDNVLCSGDNKKEGKRKIESNDVRAALKEQVDEVGRSIFFGKSQGSAEQNDICSLDLSFVMENHNEGLPRLPPVKLKSEDKSVNIQWEEKFDHHGPGENLTNADNTFLIGSFLDVPVGQEINSSGGKRALGSSWLSVSQGIAEDASDLVSGFATVGDGLSESVDYPNEYWDSDEYDDDDDVGYMRQPIEDETWFLAHEIDYPSDNEKGTGHGSIQDQRERGPTKVEDDDQSFAEDDSYFSGEQYFQSKNIDQVPISNDPIGLSMAEMYGRNDENDIIAQCDGQLMDEEELSLMRSEPVWQGFVTRTNELVMLGNGRVLNECERTRPDDLCMDDDQHGSVRSIGVGINSDAADIGSEVRESLIGGSSEGDLEYFRDQDVGIGVSSYSQHDTDKRKASKQDSDKYVMGNEKGASRIVQNYSDGGFSFPLPLRDGGSNSGKSLWSTKCNAVTGDEADDCGNGLMESDEMLASWRRKGNASSSDKSSQDRNNDNAIISANSTSSTLSNYGYAEGMHVKEGEDDKISDAGEEDPGTTLEDEEAAAVQEQVRQIKAQEEEFETFNLKIVHRKNRTGFEEDKNFHVVLNSVIAGRYHVTEYLGSAAFSKAIQAHDLHTGMDVCVKIIKNNKDFFDQSLDEIKLLKYVNKHDPADKYHILRLYDYFYYREHLLIVCELLKANLYEFQKFNRESGGEVYFTMPRLQSITIQCLEALQFLHGLGLIHCDLKPENILVKSYSRCEVKVIDLGSSCFETDHLCSYVQSRSYRAPEVILGLPYEKKIDLWSLGCILAELCTGNVLFQNDSPATLLARVIGIIGPIDQSMLAKGRDVYKYFTKNHMLYERNQETNRLEYLIPKKTSLRHRLPMGDQGFIDFVAHLLEINPKKRPSASEALKHAWLSYPYEPISS
ncbi:PREDICTED: uncharacterized protein LOC104588662 isoform X2 [Nelumbo nucifera]|uniref:Protein kinase domain-containing protein n=2 Tax=Nelumbo nucifera TaxID=4432 RepID=A0A822YWH5_NELNU|nr:PREDICTED: uncharacterized protein LOC104588662 isoform X2 [Nelumbo nucifera]DAD35871.1 TPA_asm: hypothetical protein HUJ06_006511 [Nelumbo nucifera]